MTGGSQTNCRHFRPPAPQLSSESMTSHQMLWAVLFNPLSLWRREHFEEPMVVIRTALGTSVVVNDTELIKQVLVDDAQNYGRDSLQKRILQRMTGRSLFLAEGADWRFQRKILAPFFSAKALAAYLPGMTAAAEDAVSRFLRTDSVGINLGQEMATLTVDVLGRTIFSNMLGESPSAIANSVRQFADVNGPVELGDILGFPSWIPGIRRILGWRATAKVQQRAKRLIAESKASDLAPGSDIISALLSARDPETGKPLNERVVESNVSTLLGAGSDTVAVALSWSIYLLSQDTHVREAVEAEIDTHLKGERMTLEILDQLVWTRAVIEEAMRLYPPAPLIGRMTRNEGRLGGELLPAGTTILISPWVIHRHVQLWNNPDIFEPERFLPGRRELIPRFAYLPFGAGPGVCLGMNFALQEAVVVLATLIKKLYFERADDHPVRLCQRLTLQTETPLRMRAKGRTT